MTYDRQQDVVYGYQDGTRLIMDVMTPSERQNGAAVLWNLDEGVKSCLGFEGSVRGTLSKDLISRFKLSADLLLNAGYVVFAVAHRNSPRYRMDEILPDLSRAVHFVRCHAGRFGIEPHRIGITRSTSGGGLALIAGASPPVPDSQSEDPVDRVPSQVNAIVAHCPFSDLLNYGRPDRPPNDFWGRTIPAFDFHAWNEASSRYERIVEPDQQKAFFQLCSPLNYISSSMPPASKTWEYLTN